MPVDLIHAHKSAMRFHLATEVMAASVMGFSLEELRYKKHSLPLIIHEKGILYAIYAGTPKHNNDFITPYVVNASFSLELHLKLLLFLETGKWTGGHALEILYGRLSAESRLFVDRQVIESMKHPEIDSALNLLKNHNVVVEWNALNLLRRSNIAFQNWRYAFEGQPGCFAGYSPIQNALKQRVDELSKGNQS